MVGVSIASATLSDALPDTVPTKNPLVCSACPQAERRVKDTAVIVYILFMGNSTAFSRANWVEMDRKTIALCVICPVLFAGCEKDAPSDMFLAGEPLIGEAVISQTFSVEKPDSMTFYLTSPGNSPLIVIEVFTPETVESGDTVALCSDPFLAIETDRLIMELEFALATGDTTAADSLQAVLSDSSVYTPLLIQSAGRMKLFVSAGNTVQPGDTVASVTGPPPDSLFIILPQDGQILWPEPVTGRRLPSGGLMVSGYWPGDSTVIPGFYSVPSHFVHEENLSTFLLTDSGDTLHITVAGNRNGLRMIYSSVPLDSLTLSGWD